MDCHKIYVCCPNKYLYFVNSNYIFNGNAEELEKDWYEQYGNTDNKCDNM